MVISFINCKNSVQFFRPLYDSAVTDDNNTKPIITVTNFGKMSWLHFKSESIKHNSCQLFSTFKNYKFLCSFK